MIISLRERGVTGDFDSGTESRINAGEHAALEIRIGLGEIIEPRRQVDVLEDAPEITQLLTELVLLGQGGLAQTRNQRPVGITGHPLFERAVSGEIGAQAVIRAPVGFEGYAFPIQMEIVRV